MTGPAALPAPRDPAGPARGPGATAEDTELTELRELYQQAPCGYLTTTDDGTITQVNDTFLHWTGHRRENLVGTRLHTLMPIGDQILYTSHCMPQLGTAGAVAEVLVEVTGADRSRRAALLSATRTPARGARPAVVRVIIFAAHERRRYEQELVAAVRRAEESEARRAAAEADMRHLALHDPLTGLLNRAGLSAHLTALPDADARGAARGSLGVLFVDLDHFKAVNDSLGHAAGDELLTVVASRLRSAVRATGTLARLSGDEFVVVDSLDDSAQAARLAHRLLEAVTAPVVIQGLEIVISASIGAAVATSDSDTSERLLHHADVAMYRAKARGRNCVELHDPTRTDPAVDRLRLLGELRRGIERGELRVHYQPRVDLGSGVLAGVEALVRWQHPRRGLLPPSEFIEVAEQSGLIRHLGARVLDEAVGQVSRWVAAPGARPVQVAVNLSTRQLTDPDLVGTVTEILDRHGLDPALLTLEVTETALMGDPDTSLATLTALKALGIEFAVDDFGTGYASLTYLQRFPIDELKIDRSFVTGLGSSTDDRAIVATCVQLAHAMGIRAVAEGVETEHQRQVLLDLGCDLAQGYHYARPLPAGALAEWASRRAAPQP